MLFYTTFNYSQLVVLDTSSRVNVTSLHAKFNQRFRANTIVLTVRKLRVYISLKSTISRVYIGNSLVWFILLLWFARSVFSKSTTMSQAQSEVMVCANVRRLCTVSPIGDMASSPWCVQSRRAAPSWRREAAERCGAMTRRALHHIGFGLGEGGDFHHKCWCGEPNFD